MKNKLTLLSLSLLFSLGLLAQAPDLINYQAVARDASGEALTSTSVNVLFEIRQSTANGTVVYSETHAATTNQFGLFTLEIGGGTPVTGTFAGINWSTGLYYLYMEVNGDAMPATQLLSVPYALHANTATSGTPGAPGHNSLTNATVEAPGVNCANGGYFIEVGADDNDDNILQAGEVDITYYVCNGLDGVANNNDTSATNEIQALSISNDTIFLSNGGFVVLPPASGDNWGTQVAITSGGNISGDGTSGNPLAVIDNDTSATNELQDLSVTGNNINITNGTGTTLSATTPSIGDYLYWNGVNWVAQTITGDNWGTQVVATTGGNISGDGTSGNPLAVIDNDTSATNELQNLTLSLPNSSTVNIGITGGNSFIFGINDADADSTNELQQLTFIDPNLTLSNGGGTVNLSALQGTDNQDLTLTGNTLSLTNDPSTVDLSSYLDNTDAQTLTYNSTNQNLSILNGNTVTLNVNDADFDITNELITNFGVNTTTDSLIINEGGTRHAVAFSAFNDGDWTVAGANTYSLNNVGVGIANPAYQFHVHNPNVNAGSIISVTNNTTGAAISDGLVLGVDNLGNAVLTNREATNMRLMTNNQTRILIDPTGNVSIGPTAPTTRLDVDGRIRMRTGATNGYIPVSDAAGNMTWTDPTTVSTADDGDWIRFNNGTNDYLINDNSHHVRVFGPSTTTASLQNNTSLFEIYANGGDRTMEVNGRNAAIGDIDGGGAGANIFIDGDGSGDISFNNYATTAMIVQSNSRVGIGIVAPGSQLDVQTTTTERAAQFNSNFASAANKFGVYAIAQGGGNGENRGVQGEATGATTNIGIRGRAFGGTNNFAGYFELGDVYVQEDLRIGVTTAGSQNPKVYINTPAAIASNTSIEISNSYNGNLMTYGAYNRLTPGGTGGATGIWNYITPSASSSANVYGTRNLILNGGNGTRYAVASSTNANGSGDVYGTYNTVNHDGTGDVYGYYFSATGSSTSGIIRGLWIQGSTTNYIGGDLGVGVQGPANRLDVEGAAVIGAIYSGTNTAPTNGLLVYGDVGIGTSSPSSKVHAVATTTSNAGHFDNLSTAGGTGVRGEVNQNNASATGARYGLYGAGWYGQSTNYGVYAYGFGGTNSYGVYGLSGGASGNNYGVYCSGNGAYTGSWTNVSDIRFKKNIQDYNGALDKLMQLEAKEYEYTNDEKYAHMNFSKGKQIGFIAQEVEKVFPSLVEDGAHPGKLDKETGEEGEAINYKGMNYIGLVPVLVKSVQEQQKLIEELRKEIEELKQKQ